MVSVSRDNRQQDILTIDRLVSAGVISAVSELRVDVVHTVEITTVIVCTVGKGIMIQIQGIDHNKSRDSILQSTSMYRYSIPIK